MKELIQNRFLILLFTIGFFALIFSCQSKVSSDLPAGLIEKKTIPVLDVVNFETTFNDSGVVRYHLTAPRLLRFPEQRNPKKEEYMEFPQGFHLQKFNPDKTIESEMSANYGKNYMSQQLYYASGNVVMINAKGDTLRTEELNYDTKKDLIYTDKFVSIKKGDQYITGTGGFKSDAQMTKWTFMKTQGHVYMQDE
jgi:LPS export ABC transporter protein LptC